MRKQKTSKLLKTVQHWYGEWATRYGEGFFLYGAFSSALTSIWITQNILRESYNKIMPLWVIGLVFVISFSALAWLIDKFGLIEARANACAKRNKYMRKIK